MISLFSGLSLRLSLISGSIQTIFLRHLQMNIKIFPGIKSQDFVIDWFIIMKGQTGALS